MDDDLYSLSGELEINKASDDAEKKAGFGKNNPAPISVEGARSISSPPESKVSSANDKETSGPPADLVHQTKIDQDHSDSLLRTDSKSIANAGGRIDSAPVSGNVGEKGRSAEYSANAAPVAGSDGGQRTAASSEKAAMPQGVTVASDSAVQGGAGGKAAAPEKVASASQNENSASGNTERAISSQASGEKSTFNVASSSGEVKESSSSSASASTSVKGEIDTSSKKQSGGSEATESGGKEISSGRTKGDGASNDAVKSETSKSQTAKSEPSSSENEKSSESKSRGARSEADDDSSPRGRKEKDSSSDGGKGGKEISAESGQGNSKDSANDSGKGGGKDRVKDNASDITDSKSSIRAEASGKAGHAETGMRQSEQAGKLEATDRSIQPPRSGDTKGEGSGIALIDGKMLNDANKIRSSDGGGIGGGSSGSTFDARGRKPDKSPDGGDGRPGKSPSDKAPNDISDKSRGNADKVTLTVDTKTGGKQEVNLSDKSTQKNMLDTINMVQKGQQNKAEKSFPVIAEIVSQFTVKQVEQVKHILTTAFDAIKSGKQNESGKNEKLSKAEVKVVQADAAKDIASLILLVRGQAKSAVIDAPKEAQLSKDQVSARAAEQMQKKNQQTERVERDPIKAQESKTTKQVARAEEVKRSDLQSQQRLEAKSDFRKEPTRDANSIARPESRTNSRTDARSDVRPDVRPEARFDIKADQKRDITRDARVEAKQDSKQEPKSESKLDSKPDSKLEAKSEARKPTEAKESFNNKVVRDGAVMFDRLIGMIKKTLGDELLVAENRNKLMENHNLFMSDLVVKFSSDSTVQRGPFDDTGPITDERIDQIFEKMQKSVAPQAANADETNVHGNTTQERRSYTVEAGDTIHSIARDQLSDPNLASLICQLNPDLCRIEEINEELPPGIQITIPNQADVNAHKKEHASTIGI